MLRNALIGMTLLIGTSGAPGAGQNAPPQQPQLPPVIPHISFPGAGGGYDGISPGVQRQQAIARDKERQQRLVEDTNKLLELATDLKTQVDKTNRGIMSIDVIKKAEEIEKLAHSVKERMKG